MIGRSIFAAHIMVTPQEVFKVLSHPPALHAALVHAPIMLSMIGALLCALVLATRGRNLTLQVSAGVCLATALVSALAAANAGENAFALMGDAPDIARQNAETHRWMAEKVWLLAGITLITWGLSWAKPARLSLAGRIGAAASSGVLAAWVGLTAHHGGTLVYQHGIGVQPQTPAPGGSSRGDPPEDPRIAFFESDVRPLLTQHCMSCHGPDQFAASGLSLTSPAGLLTGGKRGPAVDPGNPAGSLLLNAVKGQSMPRMPYNQAPLSAEQIAVLEKWIRQGAVWH